MLLAVYGTLRRKGGANVMLRLVGAEFVGKGIVRGYKLYASRIPFAVKGSPNDSIVVEVYDVPNEKVPLIDFYESGYERVKVVVDMESKKLEAWLYEWKGDLEGCERLECGDWVEHIERKCRCFR